MSKEKSHGKKFAFFSFFMMFFIFTSVNATFPHVKTLDSMNVHISYSTNIVLIPKTSDAKVSIMNFSIFRYPQTDYRQETITKEIPSAGSVLRDGAGNEYVNFIWEKPALNERYDMTIDADLKIIARPQRIKNVPAFPLDPSLIVNYRQYLEFGPLTSPNEDIEVKAFELTQNAEDIMDAAAAITHWISDNFEYDINYGENVTAATECFYHKRGTCDEFAQLFLAMVRSVGIPARYISGYSFGAYGNNEDWGPHAWAEIYVPNTGWVPFDPTYREVGFVDASHMKISTSIDGNTTSERNFVKLIDVDISKATPSFDIEVTDFSQKNKPISIEMTAPKEVSLNDHAAIHAKVKNLKDSVIFTTLELGYKNKEANFNLVYGKDTVDIRLEPHEEKNIYWVLQPTALKESCEEIESGDTIRKKCSVYAFNFTISGEDIAWKVIEFNPLKKKDSLLSVDLWKENFLPGETFNIQLNTSKPTKILIISEIGLEGENIREISGASEISFVAKKSGKIMFYCLNDGTFIEKNIVVTNDQTFHAMVNTPTLIERGKPLPVEVIIEGQSKKKMDGIRATVYIDSIDITSKENIVVNPGEKKKINFAIDSRDISVGSHTIMVIVGNGQKYRFFKKFTITGEPKLEVIFTLPSTVKINPDVPYKGQLILKNTGTAPAENLELTISVPKYFKLSQFQFPTKLAAGEVFKSDLFLHTSYKLKEKAYSFELLLIHEDKAEKASVNVTVKVNLIERFIFLIKSFFAGIFK